jgi:pimeloyl-ACP methyl ester carboxylesterase
VSTSWCCKNGFATGSAGYGNVASQDELAALGELVRTTWGNGELLAAIVPHFADDPEFCARFERMGARPSAAAALICNIASTDVRALLGRSGAPTLVVYSGDLTVSSVEESGHLAEVVPNARLFEGSSSTFYWGGGVVE